MFILSLAALEGALRIGAVGYGYFNQKASLSEPARPMTGRSTILCMGESTTAWGLNEAYPALLQNKLDSELGKGKYIVVNLGITGTDTQEILKNLDENIQRYQPKIVISMMGINDWWSVEYEDSFYRRLRIYKFLKILVANAKSWMDPPPSPVVLTEKTNNPVIDGDPIRLPGQPAVELKINSGLRNYNEKKYADAIDDFKSVEKNSVLPKSVSYWLGRSYFSIGFKNEALRYFKIYEKLENTAEGFLNLATFFSDNSSQFDKTNLTRAKKYLDLAYRGDPDNGQVLTMMGIWHLKNMNPVAAKPLFEKSAGLKNPSALTLLLLGRSYVEEKNYEKAIEVFKRGLEDTSKTVLLLWGDLLETLVKIKNFEEAQRYYTLAMRRYPDQNIFHSRIRRMGIPGLKIAKWDGLTVKNQIKNFLMYPPTRENYEKFAEILQKHGIKYAAMQYPLRNSDELKVILKNYPQTIFIDNHDNFESALKNHSYDDLFMDRFAQDFGHFTPAGAQLVANRIFEVFMNERVLVQNP